MDVSCKEILGALEEGFRPDQAGDWNAVIQFSFTGDKGGDYYLEVKDQECKLHEGKTDNATATVKTKDQVWIDISMGKINPMTAFMTGKVSVGGHMGDIMKLNNRNIFDVKKPG